MNEYHAIRLSDGLLPFEKLRYYMEYFCNCLPDKASISFEQFCSPKNIINHDVGEGWKERGFASQCWITLSAGSIYHSVYHKILSNALQPPVTVTISPLSEKELDEFKDASKDLINKMLSVPVKQVTND